MTYGPAQTPHAVVADGGRHSALRAGEPGPDQPDPGDAWMKAVYEAHGAPLYWYLVRLTLGDRRAAEDLLQEVLLRAWRNGGRLTGGVENLRPWLFTVARRLAVDAARTRLRRPVPVEGGDEDRATPFDLADCVATADAVRRALATLSPLHRQVVVELYLRDSSVLQVAQRLGVPEGTVKSRAFYALKAMRAAIS